MEKTFEHVNYSNIGENDLKESNLLSYKEIDERINKSKQVYIPDAIDKLLNNMTDKKMNGTKIIVEEYDDTDDDADHDIEKGIVNKMKIFTSQ